MIVVMRDNATMLQTSRVIQEIEKMGFVPRPSHGTAQTVIGVLGARDLAQLEPLAALPGVDQVAPIDRGFKLVNRAYRDEPTVVKVGETAIGSDEFVVMAGPCSVESRDQLLSAARAVHAAGARVLRGGAFKPRTSPYSFQGMGEDGLKLLAEAREETGLAVVTEVMTPELVPLVASYADILQIGARNMQNYGLLEAVGKVRKPVMLKRGLMSTVEELLMAAEYILSNGNHRVLLCERGIRTFEKATRNTCDISAIPVIKEMSHLPVIIDPSHAAGRRDCIASLSRAAAAAGADGIIVEVHPRPEEALSDGAQSLTPPMFQELMAGLRPVVEAVGRKMPEAVVADVVVDESA